MTTIDDEKKYILSKYAPTKKGRHWIYIVDLLCEIVDALITYEGIEDDDYDVNEDNQNVFLGYADLVLFLQSQGFETKLDKDKLVLVRVKLINNHT